MSNRWLFNVAIFTAGAAIGSVVTWKYLKTKYERIAQEEIDSVKETFAEESNKMVDNELVYDPDSDDIHEYIELLRSKYLTESSQPNYIDPIEESTVEITEDKPYVISPDELGEYETVYLTYYSDDILADELDEIIEDVDNVVGRESLKHFGEYADACVFVRNDVRQEEYEITLVPERYIDVVNRNPHFTEGE